MAEPGNTERQHQIGSETWATLSPQQMDSLRRQGKVEFKQNIHMSGDYLSITDETDAGRPYQIATALKAARDGLAVHRRENISINAPVYVDAALVTNTDGGKVVVFGRGDCSKQEYEDDLSEVLRSANGLLGVFDKPLIPTRQR